jgi:DNA (cytosine-5)-methyltransferase 1
VAKLQALPHTLPAGREEKLYEDLNGLLETDVEPKYYIASGYFETLVKHRARQEGKGYGFGYRVVNDPTVEHPVANTLLATGGSGKERNLIYDPKEGIAGIMIKGKKTPLNDKGIRIMTPTEWGKLQGFINYAFVSEDGSDAFSFPERTPDAQKYKQFGNSVTIPVIEDMADFMLECITTMMSD